MINDDRESQKESVEQEITDSPKQELEQQKQVQEEEEEEESSEDVLLYIYRI
jgi:hypothetical protein